MVTAAREQLMGVLEPLIEQLGYELVDLEWSAGVRNGVLRIFIDHVHAERGHIGIEDCERVSREVSALLDVEDPLPGAYTLEVSSPGFDRPLRKPTHFARFVGERVWVELREARAGRKRYTGILCAADEVGVKIEVDGQVVNVDYAELGKARLAG